MVIIKCSTLEDRASSLSQHKEGHFSFGNQKVLDMKNGVSRICVFLAPETYVILREGVSSKSH